MAGGLTSFTLPVSDWWLCLVGPFKGWPPQRTLNGTTLEMDDKMSRITTKRTENAKLNSDGGSRTLLAAVNIS
jgi:hypothetical protein